MSNHQQTYVANLIGEFLDTFPAEEIYPTGCQALRRAELHRVINPLVPEGIPSEWVQPDYSYWSHPGSLRLHEEIKSHVHSAMDQKFQQNCLDPNGEIRDSAAQAIWDIRQRWKSEDAAAAKSRKTRRNS